MTPMAQIASFDLVFPYCCGTMQITADSCGKHNLAMRIGEAKRIFDDRLVSTRRWYYRRWGNQPIHS
jgi:hypothetical protein